VRTLAVLVLRVQRRGPHDLPVEPTFELSCRPAGERIHPALSRVLLHQFDQEQRLRIGPLHEREHGTVDHRPWFGVVPVDRLGKSAQFLLVVGIDAPAEHGGFEPACEQLDLLEPLLAIGLWLRRVGDGGELHARHLRLPHHITAAPNLDLVRLAREGLEVVDHSLVVGEQARSRVGPALADVQHRQRILGAPRVVRPPQRSNHRHRLLALCAGEDLVPAQHLVDDRTRLLGLGLLGRTGLLRILRDDRSEAEGCHAEATDPTPGAQS
jgi:hypothetical protein